MGVSPPVTFPPSEKKKHNKKRHQRHHKSDTESSEETYDDGDLDKELTNEYEQLDAERKTTCDGDTCKLLD